MEFKLDLNSPIPLHAQIEKHLRELIERDEYKQGDKLLPRELVLSKQLGVSRNTIRQAINKLVQEGLVERKKGVGSKVVSQKISTRLDNWISFTKEMRNQGIDVVNYLVKIELVVANDNICNALSIPKGKKVWCLSKIRGSKNAKYLYSLSYFHPRVGIKGTEDFNNPLYEILEKQHDVIVSTSKEKLKAIKANDEIANMLDIEEGIPLLERERLVCDLGDRPIEFNTVYYHTDYFTYDIDIKRNL